MIVDIHAQQQPILAAVEGGDEVLYSANASLHYCCMYARIHRRCKGNCCAVHAGSYLTAMRVAMPLFGPRLSDAQQTQPPNMLPDLHHSLFLCLVTCCLYRNVSACLPTLSPGREGTKASVRGPHGEVQVPRCFRLPGDGRAVLSCCKKM